MTPERKIKQGRAEARKAIHHCKTQQEAIDKLIDRGFAVSKSQARRIYHLFGY